MARIALENEVLRRYFRLQLAAYDYHSETPDLSHILPVVKRMIIKETLIYTLGNKTKAAKLLGINRHTIAKYCNLE
ncbi:helix-turn-helix domain-containing protein [Vibrio paucivorans]